MKIAFEFDGATPKQIAAVLEKFTSEFEGRPVKEDGVEVDQATIGKINIYVSLKGKESGGFCAFVKNGKEIDWHVKKPAKNSTKPRKRQIYDNQELGYVICE